MNAWPEDMTVGPIREWPGQLTSNRVPSLFKAPLSNTLGILRREVANLADTKQQRESAEVLIAVPAEQFRLDGRPYANAKAAHPGVIFSIDSKHGHLSYPCDTFTTWQDNLRAVALALDALRKVDRYGVTKQGEQYRGFLAIEAGPATAVGFTSASSALHWLRDFTGQSGAPRALILAAQRRAHPDLGGDENDFQRVMAAEHALREGGHL
ncbi:molecular chaperone DnaJ [Microbacterium resistens]|uniref:hypothetical protein n=1 Tax=Microbacterium resistens TaxID=156977 RepID=UPI001C59C042|nr:hypothetical protein [Microbacterium resistens]MBW1639270.1 molecular chaperone DnaJ [Microbacterium resistens]